MTAAKIIVFTLAMLAVDILFYYTAHSDTERFWNQVTASLIIGLAVYLFSLGDRR